MFISLFLRQQWRDAAVYKVVDSKLPIGWRGGRSGLDKVGGGVVGEDYGGDGVRKDMIMRDYFKSP